MLIIWDDSLYLLQGKEVIDFYLNELISQGITHIPRWTPGASGGYQHVSRIATSGHPCNIVEPTAVLEASSAPLQLRGETVGHSSTVEQDGKSGKLRLWEFVKLGNIIYIPY